MSDGLRGDAFLEDAFDRRYATLRMSAPRSAVSAPARIREDVYQDHFLRLLPRRRRSATVNISKAWLLRVTRCCIDLRRSALVEAHPAHLETTARVHAAPLSEEEGSRALAGSQRCRPICGTADVWLRYVEGYGTDEIAKCRELPSGDGTDKIPASRTQKMQTELEGELNDEHVGRNMKISGANELKAVSLRRCVRKGKERGSRSASMRAAAKRLLRRVAHLRCLGSAAAAGWAEAIP